MISETLIYGFLDKLSSDHPATGVAYAISETGEILVDVPGICNVKDAKKQLGMDGISRNAHLIYSTKIPTGWKYEFVEPEEILSHKKLIGILKKIDAEEFLIFCYNKNI